MLFGGKLSLLLICHFVQGQQRGIHKVHNLILNPEKYSRCQTTQIQQIVASPGYEPVTIENNVCVGWCYSYSIPSTQPAEPGELIGPYCDSCQPVETKCYHVTLKADEKNTDGAKFFQKRVQIIRNCSCMSCEKIQKENCEIAGESTLELPQNLFSNKTMEVVQEVPELLHFQNHVKPQILHFDVTNASSNEPKFELTSNLMNLLKNIQNDDTYEQSQLKDLMKLLKNDLSDRSLMDFVNYVNIHNSDDFELDLSRLKDVLINHIDLSRNHNGEIEQDLKKFNLPATFGSERHHLQHHLGEEIPVGLNLERLVKGPHGSMVLAPDLKVEEKLNIDSDVLKPNHDGVVIAYENHGKNILDD